ncbi:MAG: MBL fold metallo-hydrolase [Sphingopyxis sp.]|nr:MBL fold metallo-hydrolase [Sphingopyxis sp.]
MRRFSLFAAALLCTAVGPACAQQDFSKVEIKAQPVAPGIAVLFGAGGNIGVSHGPDGTVLIDDQFAPLTPKIQAAVAGLGASPVKYLINTHWHFDHTGGNENFGNAGALILAHDHVRDRMATEQKGRFGTTPPSPPKALPVVTYHDGISLHLNGDRVRTMHLKHAHTDGDSVVMWEKANVVHMGDTFFHQVTLPFIDLNSGGSAKGLLAGITKVLAIIDDKTVVIPGHGPVATKADLTAYRDMLTSVIASVEAAKATGKTLPEIQAMKPAAKWDTNPNGFIKGDDFVATVFASLAMPAHDHGEKAPKDHGGAEHQH